MGEETVVPVPVTAEAKSRSLLRSFFSAFRAPSQRFISAVALFSVWGWMVYIGKAPAADFVSAVRDALIALGVFHASLASPNGHGDTSGKVD